MHRMALGRPQQRPKYRALLIERFELLFTPGRRIDGLWIGAMKDKGWPDLDRVEEALRLIKTHDRIRYNRLVRDLERVWVRLLPASAASFNPALKACQIDERFVRAETTSPELIASTIVHEGTHARLMRCGIGYEEEIRPRVEAVCVRREMAFAAKLPNGVPEREQAADALAALPPDYLTNSAFSDRDRKGRAEALRYLGFSDWHIRATFRIAEVIWRLRRIVRRARHFFRA